MPKLAANLSMLFTEVPFPDRYQAARDAGFNAVECMFPYDETPETLAKALQETGLEQVLFNAPPGDWAAGERGTAALPGRIREFRDGIDKALDYANALSCPRLHVMAGVIPDQSDKGQYEAILLENLAWAADKADARDVTILLEPINALDMPGYLYSRTDAVVSLLNKLGRPNVMLQLDLYHRQMTEGRLLEAIQEYLPQIGHIQIAGVPGRNEPAPSEIDINYLFEHLDACGYTGWVGCEYHPKTDTLSGLEWAAPWLRQV